MSRALALSLICFALLSGLAYAQYDGTIRGVVTDPAGAVIAGAQVTVVNKANNDTRTATTDDQGGYVVTSLPPGTYEVHVQQTSFAEFIAKDVELHVSSSYDVNAQLKLSKAANEQVTVEANAIQVQSDTAALGAVIEEKQVLELPLNGRSFKNLALLQPGVSARDNFDVKDKGLLSGSDISVNGNPVTNNLWLVDGVNDNDLGSNRTLLIYPSIDAISEFKFLRNAYGPEYGQAAGGIISIITKSGSNQFHGSAYYFGRNDALNAKDFFTTPGNKIPPLRRNDYGFAVGGPVKKDKLFFFYSEEWNKQKSGFTRSSCVPTVDERNGDFTNAWQAWKDAGSDTQHVVDQCNAALPAVPGTRGTGPGQTLTGIELDVLTTALDPAGVLMTDQLPLANLAGHTTPNSGNNWVSALNSSLNWRQENARVDFNLNRKNTLTFRYTQENWTNPAPNAQAYWGDDPFSTVEGSWKQPSKSVMVKDMTVLSSTLTNEAQLSYSNNRIYATLGGTGVTTADALGNTYTPATFVSALEAAIPPSFPADTKKKGGMPPDAAWGGFGSYGGGNTIWLIAPWNNTSDLYNFRDDLAKVRGTHTLKAGVFIGYNKKHEPSEGGHDQPSFSFNNGNNGAGPGNSYNSLFDLLTVGSQYGFGENSANLFPTAVWHDYEFYVQDNWKVRRNLTLEYGFRWSFLRQPTEQHNMITSWELSRYDPSLPASDACNGLIIVPGTHPCAGFASPGTPGVNNALVPNNNHLIAPRLGVSWDPWSQGKTVFRAGVGQFYQRERVSRVTALMGQNAPFSVNFSSTRTMDCLPADNCPLAAGGSASPGAATSPDSFIPNSWQWNVTMQHEIRRNTTMEIGYVGNRGLHLTSDRDANGVLPQDRVLFAFQGTPVCVFLGPSCQGAVTRPASNFGGIDQFGHAGSSSYHSLQALVSSRIGKSQVQAAYTWSHTITNVDSGDSSGNGFGTHSQTDPYNINADRGNSTINRPQMFVANAIFFLPTFAKSNAFEQQVLGGWELTTIFQAISGNSLTNFYNPTLQDQNICVAPDGSTIPGCGPAFNTSNNISDVQGTGNGAGNINAGRFMGTGIGCNADLSPDQASKFGIKPGGAQLWNPAAFTLVGYQIGTIGNSPKGACHGPREVNLDLSMDKTWKVNEKLSVQFRFDAFDALNHPQFQSLNIHAGGVTGVSCGTTACSPTNNIVTSTTGGYASNFGQVSATRVGGNRELQYAIKFIF
jgi:Carboxypeptidase regulatory-like domain